jgi:hypothetical protein
MSSSLRARGLAESNPSVDESLLLALAESASRCDLLLAQNESVFQSPGYHPVEILQLLLRLIGEARSRLLQQRSDSPAFWQACGDAFVRAAECVSTCCIHQQCLNVVGREAEEKFRRTAQLLFLETIRSAQRHAR